MLPALMVLILSVSDPLASMAFQRVLSRSSQLRLFDYLFRARQASEPLILPTSSRESGVQFVLLIWNVIEVAFPVLILGRWTEAVSILLLLNVLLHRNQIMKIILRMVI